MKKYLLAIRFDPLLSALNFMKSHWQVLLCLGMIAGIGRVIQLGGFGAVSGTVHVILEILIEASRISILLFVIGIANVKNGLRHIVALFSGKIAVRSYLRTAWHKLKLRGIDVLVSFVAFLVIAGAINMLIDQLAYETCLYLSLKREGVLVDTSSEWTIILFFKNLSVIPITLVFETVLLLWLVNKWPARRQHV